MAAIFLINPTIFYVSTPFQIVVEGNEFWLHTDLLLHHSKVFDLMMKGDMSEAPKG